MSGVDKLEEIHKDGVAEINGIEYKLEKMRHRERRQVFGFFTRVQGLMQESNFDWLNWPDFKQIEKLMGDYVTVDGMQLSKLQGHWDEYPENYIMFIVNIMGAMSYPFMRGMATS